MLRRGAVVRRSLGAADFCAVYAALILTAVVIANDDVRWGALLLGPLFILAAKAVGLYDRDEHLLHKTTVDELPKLFALASVTTLVVWLGEGTIVTGVLERGSAIALWVLLCILLVCVRAFARAVAQWASPPERCLVLGSRADADLLEDQLELAPFVRARVVGFVAAEAARDEAGRWYENGGSGSTNGTRHALELPPRIGEILVEQGIDRVVIARPPGALEGADSLLQALRRLRAYGVKVSLLPRGPRVAGPKVEVDQLPGITLLGIRGLEISGSSRLIKRAFDLSGAGLGLLVLSPVLLTIAIAIKIDSPGPVLFRQRRVGRRGREFKMLKFRSMVSEADQLKEELRHMNEGGPGLFKISEDPRITRVGRILRRLSLDELPQLWNVVRGEMSLVGPRPLVREEDGQIEGWYRRRLEVAPGMTGHWQILCATRRISLPEMAKLDYLYVANWTLWSDIRLLLRTIPFVVGGRGV